MKKFFSYSNRYFLQKALDSIKNRLQLTNSKRQVVPDEFRWVPVFSKNAEAALIAVKKSLLKTISASHWLTRPALFASIVLHGLVLLMPLPDRSQPQEPELTSAVSQVPITRQPQPTAKLQPSPSPTPTKPKPQAIAPTPSPLQLNRPVVQRPSAVPSPTQPIQTKPVELTPSPSPSVAVMPDPGPPAIPFADVPILAGTESGCFGIGACHQLTDGTNFRTAGQTLETQLQAQGYQVKLRDDMEETGRKVYELHKGSETRFLNVLSSDVGSTIYLITPEPISLSDLQQSQTLQTELEATLDQLASTAANPSQFAQPEAFYNNTQPRPETEGELRLALGNLPEQLFNTLATQLQAQNFRLTAAGGYGGGLLYEVNKGAYTAYLNLVPTIDQSGTVVVLWSNLPS